MKYGNGARMLLFCLLWFVTDKPLLAETLTFEGEHARLSCSDCHLNEEGEIRGDITTAAFDEKLCTTCHKALTEKHFTGINPFVDNEVADKSRVGHRSKGSPHPFCLDCHDIHAAAGETPLLSKRFLQRAGLARSVNPHWNAYLCFCCHEGKPVKDIPPLREGGDYNKLCNRCHRSSYARADIHPVGVVPSTRTRIPADMPLQGNRVTCATCHEIRLQMGGRKRIVEQKNNRNFLRREQRSRSVFCFACHLREAYQRMNPHLQLDADGKIRETACLFCHSSRPDITVMGTETIGFAKENPNEFCSSCHHGFNRGHPAGIDHLRVPSAKMIRAIQTSVERLGVELPLYHGKIICATCHNPHQQGVLRIEASAAGSQRPDRLRLMPGNMQCLGCHFSKR